MRVHARTEATCLRVHAFKLERANIAIVSKKIEGNVGSDTHRIKCDAQHRDADTKYNAKKKKCTASGLVRREIRTVRIS